VALPILAAARHPDKIVVIATIAKPSRRT